MKEETKIHISSALGTGVGLATTEYLSEFAATVARLSGWLKFAVKGLIKGVVGIIALVLSARIPGLWAVFMECFGYGSLGGILLDLIAAIRPGGVAGAAHATAMAVGGASGKAKVVVARLKELEKAEESSESLGSLKVAV